jgi:hypothetical protein
MHRETHFEAVPPVPTFTSEQQILVHSKNLCYTFCIHAFLIKVAHTTSTFLYAHLILISIGEWWLPKVIILGSIMYDARALVTP